MRDGARAIVEMFGMYKNMVEDCVHKFCQLPSAFLSIFPRFSLLLVENYMDGAAYNTPPPLFGGICNSYARQMVTGWDNKYSRYASSGH